MKPHKASAPNPAQRAGRQAPDTPPQTVRLDRLTPAPRRPLSSYQRQCGHSAGSLGYWPSIINLDTLEIFHISARAADARRKCFACQIVRLVEQGLLTIEPCEGGGVLLVAETPASMTVGEARAELLDQLRSLVAPPVPGWPDHFVTDGAAP